MCSGAQQLSAQLSAPGALPLTSSRSGVFPRCPDTVHSGAHVVRQHAVLRPEPYGELVSADRNGTAHSTEGLFGRNIPGVVMHSLGSSHGIVTVCALPVRRSARLQTPLRMTTSRVPLPPAPKATCRLPADA